MFRVGCVGVHVCESVCGGLIHVGNLCSCMCVGILVRNHAVMCTHLSGFHVSSLLLFLHFWLCVFTHIVCIHHWVILGVATTL